MYGYHLQIGPQGADPKWAVTSCTDPKVIVALRPTRDRIDDVLAWLKPR